MSVALENELTLTTKDFMVLPSSYAKCFCYIYKYLYMNLKIRFGYVRASLRQIGKKTTAAETNRQK